MGRRMRVANEKRARLAVPASHSSPSFVNRESRITNEKKGSIGCAGEPIEPFDREKVVSRNGGYVAKPGEKYLRFTVCFERVQVSRAPGVRAPGTVFGSLLLG
jgi:hypothetical protein